MKAHEHEHHMHHHYKHLFIMTGLSFIAMYILMYAMVDNFSNVFNSVNQVYMAGLMASPMVIIELLVMRSMYKNKKANVIILATSVVAMFAFFLLIREQSGVSDKQFLRSMIPHHAGAILMCNDANLKDPENKELCEKIKAGQQAEIDQMKAKLDTLSR